MGAALWLASCPLVARVDAAQWVENSDAAVTMRDGVVLRAEARLCAGRFRGRHRMRDGNDALKEDTTLQRASTRATPWWCRMSAASASDGDLVARERRATAVRRRNFSNLQNGELAKCSAPNGLKKTIRILPRPGSSLTRRATGSELSGAAGSGGEGTRRRAIRVSLPLTDDLHRQCRSRASRLPIGYCPLARAIVKLVDQGVGFDAVLAVGMNERHPLLGVVTKPLLRVRKKAIFS